MELPLVGPFELFPEPPGVPLLIPEPEEPDTPGPPLPPELPELLFTVPGVWPIRRWHSGIRRCVKVILNAVDGGCGACIIFPSLAGFR